MARGPKFAQQTLGLHSAHATNEVAAEPACKPGSVVDSHSSRRIVTDTLKQPTRRHRGPRHCLPIWSCSRWGLPCRSVAGLAVRSYRTISPLPDLRRAIGGIFLLHFPSARAAQALPGTVPCGARTFLGIQLNDATVRPTPPSAFYCFAVNAPPRSASPIPSAVAAPPYQGATAPLKLRCDRTELAIRRRTAPCAVRH